MNNKNLLIICITAIIIVAIVAGTAFMIMDKQVKNQEQNTTQNNNTVNNTTKVNTTAEKTSTADNNNQATQSEPLEFNGKTHSQNFAEARASAQSAGCSDEQLNQLVAKEERDGGRV